MADDDNKSQATKTQQAKSQGAGDSKQESKSKQKVHPAQAERQFQEENANMPVQPIQVVRNKPNVDDEEAEQVTAGNKPNIQEAGEVAPEIDDDPSAHRKQVKQPQQQCWNCANHGKNSSLNSEGVCSSCGFEKDKLYNLDLESQKARERELAAYNY